jgi:hypothetical protein
VTSADSFRERWSTESIATIEAETLMLLLSELAEVRAARDALNAD